MALEFSKHQPKYKGQNQTPPKTSVPKASPNPAKATSTANVKTVFGTPKKQRGK